MEKSYPSLSGSASHSLCSWALRNPSMILQTCSMPCGLCAVARVKAFDVCWNMHTGDPVSRPDFVCFAPDGNGKAAEN
jgi:hypothetical protein